MPLNNRSLNVHHSYLSRLQSGGRDLEYPEESRDSPNVTLDEPSMAQESRAPSQSAPGDQDISNPIHEPRRIFQLDHASQQQFVGESTCLAFGDRILQCLNPRSTTPPLAPELQYVHNATFSRQLGNAADCKLPERIRANLLVRVALRFIGQDYHFFLHEDFLQQLEKAYDSDETPRFDAIWACKFFVVLALGELYSTSIPASRGSRPSSVPGTGYFLTAVTLLQDLFEEPSIAQIETMLLFVSRSLALHFAVIC